MKTVCKKLFSLMLVAILLVSALPFAAMAAGDITVWIIEQPNSAPANESAWFTVPEGSTQDQVYAAYKAAGGTGTFVSLEDVGGGEMVLTVAPASSGEGSGSGSGSNTGSGSGSSSTTTVSMTLTVYDKNDQRVESKTAEVDAADVLAWQNDFNGSLAAILAKFGSAYTAADVASGYANSNQVVIMLNVAGSSSNGGNGGDGGNVVAGVILKTDYCGNIPANVGDKYLDVLPIPAKPGQDFAYWQSATHGIVKADTIVEGDDTLTAYWKAPTKYTISFIDERGTEPDVIKMKQVSYGSAIGEMPVPAAREGYIFAGWKINGKYVNAETVYNWQGDVTAYAQWKLESDTEGEAMGGNAATANGEVYLEIYVNGDTSTVSKRVKITSLADDNKITQAEVETVVKKYVTAKSGYTLKYEGLFDEQSWWEYTHDPETNGAKSIVVNRDGDDYVYVMVNNVKTVAADPTNPKTGDGIFAVMSVMMGSGAAVLSLNELRKRNKI